ncbi:MAG: isoprenylcysteine carboxylmethyltransferase family protein [Spirochaetales bacterium]|nr:isoprenylcysteine carboxylmethyltransferase family protein [Spirochaetales bacterium]
MKKTTGGIVKAIRIVFSIAVAVAVIFIPAGTLAWPEAWILLGAYFVFVLALVLRIKKRDPELYQERTARQKEGKRWDKILLSVYTVFLLLMLVASGLDAVRFRLSHIPLEVKIGAFLSFLPVGLLFFLVYRENTFASKVVRVQKDRGQRVIDSGPYKVVRHPMYAAIILMIPAVPLALGSWWALIFAGLVDILFVVRTALEDKTLKDELPGYIDYAKKTRFRLIPGIW